MPYTMVFHVDGGCRRNGYANAIGAAAIVLAKNWGRPKVQRKALWSSPTPTNQRAEPTAIIMALERALQIYDEEEIRAYLDVTIYSDSQYAVNCMSTWIYGWCRNGWRNAAGHEVVNRDLISRASDLDYELKELGDVRYVYIPRYMNEEADGQCDVMLDEMERH